MELRSLRYFLAVAREGNITRAANSLRLTQPTLSRQIMDLEDELGARLFNRHSHCVSLTAEGERLQKRAEELLDLEKKTREEFLGDKKVVGGDVYIGGGETRAMALLAEICGAIRGEYPEIRFHFRGAPDIDELINKGLLDFGLIVQPADICKYDFIILPRKDIWGVLTPIGGKLAAKTEIRRADLVGEPLILPRRARADASDPFMEWAGDDYEKLNAAGTYNVVRDAVFLAKAGVGSAVAVAGLCEDRGADLCFRPFAPTLETGLNLIWKKYRMLFPAAEIFLQRALTTFQEPIA